MEEQSERAAAAPEVANRGRPLVEILSFAGCPNHLGAIELVERVSGEVGLEPEIRVLDVPDQDAAAAFPWFTDDPRGRARCRPARGGAERLCLVLPGLPHRDRDRRTAGRALGARRASPRGAGRLRMLEHLFDAELVYRSEMEPLTEDGEGELIGSGDGSVAGPAIAGQLA